MDRQNMNSASLFGDFLVRKGVIKAEELEAALVLQSDRSPRLGQLAKRRELLTHEKLCDILDHQRKRKLSFGQAAIELGYLSDYEVGELCKAQVAAHLLLGEILVELKSLTPLQLRQNLEAFDQAIGRGNGQANNDCFANN